VQLWLVYIEIKKNKRIIVQPETAIRQQQPVIMETSIQSVPAQNVQHNVVVPVQAIPAQPLQTSMPVAMAQPVQSSPMVVANAIPIQDNLGASAPPSYSQQPNQSNIATIPPSYNDKPPAY